MDQLPLPYEPPPQIQQSPRHTARNVSLGVLGTLVVVAIAFAISFAVSNGHTASPAAAAAPSATDSPCAGPHDSDVLCPGDSMPGVTEYTDTPTPVAVPLATPADFTVGVLILSKECFGSAGCDVTYRIDPKTTVGCDSSCTVTYQVSGGEDVQINSFTMTGTTATIEQTEMIQTKSSKAVLTAKVTQVLPQ
jgi:hypothetical protein